MLQVTFSLGQVAAAAKQMGAAADQLPYILARTLNDAAEVARDALIDMWPQHVNARNESFISASLTTRAARASKNDLSVLIYDKIGRGHLALHAEGGVRTPVGKHLAVPSRFVRDSKTSRGVRADQRPRFIPNSFVRNGKLYQTVGRGAARRVRLMYVLKLQTRVPQDVPFYETFAKTMNDAIHATMPKNVTRAMETRK